MLNRLRNTLIGANSQDADNSQERKRSLKELDSPVPLPISSRTTFTPSFDITTWVHPETLGQYTSVYIWLPKNSNENTLSVKVIDEGSVLQVKIKLPPPFHDMEIMHKRWLKSATAGSEKYHPKYMAYKTLVNDWNINNEEDTTSTALIPLPFPCKSNVDISYLAWSADSTLVVNADSSRSDEDLIEHKKMKPFTAD